MKKENQKIILLIASKVYGGAERNLERIISNSNISYELYYKSISISITQKKIIKNNNSI